MNYVKYGRSNVSTENNATAPKDFDQIANELCEQALSDAKTQLHPLLRHIELKRLEKRSEFFQAFRLALERRIAGKLAAMQGGRIQAVYRFEETRRRPGSWDDSIHLLLKVSRVSNTIQAMSKDLDDSLLKRLQQLGWSHFEEWQSVLEIQQVTPKEIRRGISYGAMFCAVYSKPIKVWPKKGSHEVG